MASSPQRSQPETVQEESILLEKVHVSVTLKQCCDHFGFFLVTLLIVLDLVTDIWVIVVFGQRQDTIFMGVLSGLFLLSGLILAISYSSQHYSESDQRRSLYINLCLNFPFQLGIIYQRCVHGFNKCQFCCPRQISGHTLSHGPHAQPCNLDWKFAKLKMVQGMFQCIPQLMGNTLHMLIYKEVQAIQIISAASSFASIIIGSVLHEKSRKEQASGALMGLAKVLCILVYKTLVMSTRIMAVVHFMYYFGAWVACLLMPHVAVMLSYYLYLYRQIWKIPYFTIIQHSLYSMFAYFPIHSEYRPEGEIVLFYILFMIENIVMVALPFKVTPTMPISRPFHPNSRYYFEVMLSILVGATGGLIFMCAYYFLLHKSRHTIRDTHLGWLARLCEWRKQDPHQITVTISNGQNHTISPSRLRDLLPNGSDILERDMQPMDRSAFIGDSETRSSVLQVPEHDADTQSNTSLLNANVVKFVTSSANPESGSQRERLLIQGDLQQETANRPSVLEGDDEDSDHEQDAHSHIIV